MMALLVVASQILMPTTIEAFVPRTTTVTSPSSSFSFSTAATTMMKPTAAAAAAATTMKPASTMTQLSAVSEMSDFVSTSSSLDLAALTLDPTTVLSDIVSTMIGTPIILAVPILAAFAVAGLIAFFIVSYANPEVED